MQCLHFETSQIVHKLCGKIKSEWKCGNTYQGITSGSEFIVVQFSMTYSDKS